MRASGFMGTGMERGDRHFLTVVSMKASGGTIKCLAKES